MGLRMRMALVLRHLRSLGMLLLRMRPNLGDRISKAARKKAVPLWVWG